MGKIQVIRNDDNMPIFWDKEDYKGRRYGYRNGIHTVTIPIKVPKPQADYVIKGVDSNGKHFLIEDESHSWKRNFYNWLSSQQGVYANDATNFADGYLNLKNYQGTVYNGGSQIGVTTSGSLETPYASEAIYPYPPYPVNPTLDYRGVCVGTGDTAESFDDYILATPISHGDGAGQLYYCGSLCPADKAWDSSTRTWFNYHRRFFLNLSGDTITIKEISHQGTLLLDTKRQVLFSRDLITPVNVENNTCLTVTYIYTLTIPSTGSPLRNYYNWMTSTFLGFDVMGDSFFIDGIISAKDTGGTIRGNPGGSAKAITIKDDYSTSGYVCASGSTSYGILIGTGNTAVTFNDYAMNTLITNGVGAGQMTYATEDTPLRIWNDPVMTIQHGRVITNTSGNAITVKEVGLACYLYCPSRYNVLVLRDVISDVVVANNDAIRPIYQYQVTYP